MMITCNFPDSAGNLEVKRFFSDKNASGFYEWHGWTAEKGLERLVFGVSKNPKNLQAHLERIYYCFQEQLDQQLFGALVDLLIVLDNSGLALAERMVKGSLSRLTEAQAEALGRLLTNSKNDKQDSSVNSCHSVFSEGLESSSVLLGMNYGIGKKEDDPIVLARDLVDFNQINKAIRILEKALLENPGRSELHAELLALYRASHDKLGFRSFYTDLLVKEVPLPPEWKQLNDFFTA